MAISLTSGINYSGKENNFTRDVYATLADMKAVKSFKMPEMITALCKETGNFYIYNKSNEDDPTLGRWRELKSSGGGGGGDSLIKSVNEEQFTVSPEGKLNLAFETENIDFSLL